MQGSIRMSTLTDQLVAASGSELFEVPLSLTARSLKNCFNSSPRFKSFKMPRTMGLANLLYSAMVVRGLE